MPIQNVIMPRRLLIGGGCLAEAGQILREEGALRVFIVTDSFMVSSGQVDKLTSILDKSEINWRLFADTVPDPTTDAVNAGVAAFRAGDFQAIVAFGGGSVIDTAKAVGMLAANGGQVRDYKVPKPVPQALPPLLAIPTTAGTGSEVTRFTVITDVATHEKMLINDPRLVPTAAIVDYKLTFSKPFRLTVDTGIDTLTHAIEAYISRRAGPFSDGLALSAMRRVALHLAIAARRGDDSIAREAMMLAATEGGLAFSTSSVALVHGMSRPIGAHFHVPHGLSNAMLLPAVTRFSLTHATKRYADCARVMGLAGADTGDDDAAEALAAGLEQINRDMEVPSPSSWGIAREDWDRATATMAAQALASGSPANNPRVPTAAEIIQLYETIWQ